MKVIDDGHDYLLDSYDGGEPVRLTFVKRNDPPEKYPGNKNAYPGTIMQEVLRALIERCLYVIEQEPNIETELTLACFEQALLLLEVRANRKHGRFIEMSSPGELYRAVPCKMCGHLQCVGDCLKA